MVENECKCDDILHKKDSHMAQSKMAECFEVSLIEKTAVAANIHLVLPSINNNTS